ncbi:MAG: LAGLIDADG family homing endonuclease [Thaumarchaeota archaeon]|nr:LAGLIDADG family homing endonuclease [Nitrososphaerota archaeon]
MSETAEREAESKLVWPPTKEDLQRLYVKERLSARKIAKLYGLKYASEKTAESTVLYHLKRNGILRRDPAAHIRKVTEEMVDGWVRRYEAGESLKQIAADVVDPVTVFNHLHKRGIRLRDKIEALIKTITKHPKTPFSGDLKEKAYLLGFAQGDLYVTRHGRAIRVKTGTTHPALMELFATSTPWTEYEWSLTSDLDTSFDFLHDKYSSIPKSVPRDFGTYLHYLAGIFDSEGSIYMNSHSWFEIAIANTDKEMLESIRNLLNRNSFSAKIVLGGPSQLGEGNNVWHLRIWRREEVRRFIEIVPVKHPEKRAKFNIVEKMYHRLTTIERDAITQEWSQLLSKIENDRKNFVRDAERVYRLKH